MIVTVTFEVSAVHLDLELDGGEDWADRLVSELERVQSNSKVGLVPVCFQSEAVSRTCP